MVSRTTPLQRNLPRAMFSSTRLRCLESQMVAIIPRKPVRGGKPRDIRIVRPGRGQNLTLGIVEDLGAAIVTGKYTKDNPFPVEADLTTQYGTSRSVLREAVKMLTAKGLLRARPRQGT